MTVSLVGENKRIESESGLKVKSCDFVRNVCPFSPIKGGIHAGDGLRQRFSLISLRLRRRRPQRGRNNDVRRDDSDTHQVVVRSWKPRYCVS